MGNEFSSVEALWSTFENVMAKDPEPEEGDASGGDNRKSGSEGEQHAEGEESEVLEGDTTQGEGETEAHS